MSQIRFENVNYIYSGGTTFEKQALKDVSFAVESGSFIGVIGHTGSGKSTLIQHMNGLIRPTSGKIYFHDEDITADGYKKKELRSKVGIVFQYPEYQLFEIDVLTDVAFGLISGRVQKAGDRCASAGGHQRRTIYLITF